MGGLHSRNSLWSLLAASPGASQNPLQCCKRFRRFRQPLMNVTAGCPQSQTLLRLAQPNVQFCLLRLSVSKWDGSVCSVIVAILPINDIYNLIVIVAAGQAGGHCAVAAEVRAAGPGRGSQTPGRREGAGPSRAGHGEDQQSSPEGPAAERLQQVPSGALWRPGGTGPDLGVFGGEGAGAGGDAPKERLSQ